MEIVVLLNKAPPSKMLALITNWHYGPIIKRCKCPNVFEWQCPICAVLPKECKSKATRYLIMEESVWADIKTKLPNKVEALLTMPLSEYLTQPSLGETK